MSTEERAEIIARNAAQQIEVLKALQAPTAKTLAQIRQILTGTHQAGSVHVELEVVRR